MLSSVSDVVPRISSRRSSWDTKIGGVGLLDVLDQRRGAVVGDLHQLRYFRAFVEIRTQNYEIRTQNQLKNPSRREMRCFGKLPRGLRDSMWRSLAKWVGARVSRLPWSLESAKIRNTHAKYFACVFGKQSSGGEMRCRWELKCCSHHVSHGFS